jgi:hypothetical protein
MIPGETEEFTIYCCYTGPGITEEGEYGLNIEKVYNYSRNVQQTDGSWVLEQTMYHATPFITSIDYPRVINGNVDVPVTITISLPEENPLYAPNTVLHARTDFKLDTGGAFILNNVIDARVVIPSDWQPPLLIRIKNFIMDYYIFIGAGVLILIIIGFVIIRRKK